MFWVCFVLVFFFLPLSSLFPPTSVHLFAKKGSAVIGLGMELIQQNFSATLFSLAVPFVPAGCKCDYIGNKLLKCFPLSLSLASSKTDCPCS